MVTTVAPLCLCAQRFAASISIAQNHIFAVILYIMDSVKKFYVLSRQGGSQQCSMEYFSLGEIDKEFNGDLQTCCFEDKMYCKLQFGRCF